jgi:chorismate lyase/3-hydroxybenzoate synthase
VNNPAPVARCDDLRIALESTLPSAAAGGNLLLGFHFGPNTPGSDLPGFVSIGIDPIDRDDLYECWWYRGQVDYRQVGRARIAECEDFAAIILQAPDAPPDEFRALSREIYEELLAAVGQIGHRRLVRIWNYFSDINRGDGDAEKYRQFSVGRAEAFDAAGMTNEMVPAATGIGCIRNANLSVIALASKHDFRKVENPRQVSAYRYPRDYGPRSPKFSRAGCVSLGDQRLILISGTAAIVGHESLHADDVILQCDETLNNLRKLGEIIGEREGLGVSAMLDADSVVRVYIRDSADLEAVAQRIGEFLGGSFDNVAFLHADICRRELQVEIDATKTAVAL